MAAKKLHPETRTLHMSYTGLFDGANQQAIQDRFKDETGWQLELEQQNMG
jgi:hypothetical protein